MLCVYGNKFSSEGQPVKSTIFGSRFWPTSVLGLTSLSLIPVMGAAQGVEEIVVTARKRDETKLEIPISVTALSQDGITERGIADTEALSDYTPGFTLQNLGQGGTSGRDNPNIRFRGINVQQSSPAARAGALFWDGAYISDGAGVLPLIDLERVEVIKGPQMVNFGRNTFAGAVDFVPARPTEELSGRAEVSFTPEEDNGYSVIGAIGGPLGERFGFRAAAGSITKGADYEFVDGSPLGREETLYLQGTLDFYPSDNWTVRLSGFNVDSSDTRALTSQVGPVAPGQCNRTYSGQYRAVADGSITGQFTTDISNSTLALFCGNVPDWDEQINVPLVGQANASTPLFFFSGGLDNVTTLPVEFAGKDMPSPPDGFGNEYEVWRLHLSTDYELANGHTITAFISQGESGFWGINDNNYGTGTPFGNTWLTGFVRHVEDTSIEARFISPSDGRFRYTIGASYYDQETIGGQFNLFAGLGLPNNVDLQEGDNIGVFGGVDFDLNDAFTLSLEGRWNRDEQKIIYQGDSGGPPNATVGQTQDFSVFMPRVILSWQPDGRDLNAYISWSNSFLQGIPTDAADYAIAVPAAGINPANVGFFTPRQELTALEIGLKQRIGILYYGASIYTMDWKDQTFFELSVPGFVPLNLAGDSEYFGIDIEFDAALTDWVTISGGWSYNDVEFTDFAGAGSIATSVLSPGGTILPGTQIDATGNVPRYIPELTGNLSATFNFGNVAGKPVFARVDGVYTGDFYIDNFEWNQVDAYWKFNLRAGVELSDNLRAEAFLLNATDDRSWITAGGTTSITATPARKTFGVAPRGREFGFRMVANF